MEKNRKIQIYCLLGASLVIGMFGAVCLYLGIIGEYNDAMGYFNVGSLFAPVVYCCIVGGPLLGIAGWIIFKKHRAKDAALPGGIAAIAACCVASALILYTEITDIISYMNMVPGTVKGVNVISWILSFLAVASLIISAVTARGGKAVNPVVSLLAFAPALYCASKVLLLYFDQSIAVNSPIKFICQLAYLSYMLVFTAEAGLSLGKESIFPRYVFSLCTAIAVGGVCSVAAAAVTVTGVQCAGFAGADCFAKIGLFLYVCMRFAFAANIDVSIVERAAKEKASDAVEEIAEKPCEEIFEDEVSEEEKQDDE